MSKAKAGTVQPSQPVPPIQDLITAARTKASAQGLQLDQFWTAQVRAAMEHNDKVPSAPITMTQVVNMLNLAGIRTNEKALRVFVISKLGRESWGLPGNMYNKAKK